MTGDARGNLYVASFVSQTECNILRFNPNTGKSEMIYPLSAHGLVSAGDMCFLNGYLYISCNGNKIARLNLATKELKVIKIINPPLRDDVPDVGSYGMVTLGDGFLYISNNRTGIYKVDPNTGQANPFYEYNELDLFTTGLATYPDVCNAPGCRGEVNVEIRSPQPFCSNTGVILEATGIGIATSPIYTWVLSDNSNVDAQTIKATVSGEYTIKYHSATDTCNITSSVKVNVIPYPQISLGRDTAICRSEVYTLVPRNNEFVDSYVWQDGSLTPSYKITDTGRYYVAASNVCGSSSDTIHITYKPIPVVRLRSDTAVCQYTYVELHNLETNGFPVNYRWSTGASNNSLQAYDPGVYWLDVYGVCSQEKVRDSVVVMRKIDDCECFLQIPNAFTPNGDGINDRFMMTSECVVKGTLQIYNRWGELVFSTADVLNGWNGQKGSTQQPAGLYIYKVRYKYEGRPGVFTKNGTIHLIH
jgi:gliding motility-associated-like protein